MDAHSITAITRLEDHLQKLFIMMIGLLFNTLFQTALSLSLLQQTNAEILIGQMSFKQSIDVFVIFCINVTSSETICL